MFLMKKLFCSITTCLILISQVMSYQGKTLTNPDVVKMFKAGLPDTTIVMAIRQSSPNFDTSPDALVELKNQGVSATVLDAMLQSQGGKAGPPLTGAPTNQDFPSDVSATRGVRLIDGPNSVEMKYSTGDMRSSGMLGNPFSMKVRYALKGNRAQLRLRSTSPTFEIAIPSNVQPADYFSMAKLDTKSDRRELQAAKASVMGYSNQLPKDKLIPVTIEEAQSQNTAGSSYYKLYRVKPVSPLRSGEYAFVVSSSFYDFGVDE